MYTSEGTPDFVVDQGMYYPVDANYYGYYYTGYESPSEWENHQMFFGVDGSEVQYTGGQQSENSPYVYYTPSYGYAQSPYNPFNPYIPGASIAPVDSPFVGSQQQFYSVPPTYQNVASVPYAIQPDNSISNSSTTNSLVVETGATNRVPSRNRNAPTTDVRNIPKVANSAGSSSEKTTIPNSGQNRQLGIDRNVSKGSSSGQLDIERNSIPTVATNNNNLRPYVGPDTGSERGPRSRRLGNQLIVKAYTTKAGNPDAEGNIVIYPNHYNKEDLRIDYKNAKFFVIKSYSEDDVHKSIKYNVWSSTLHGNKKLQTAYEDAQRIATEKACECPIFLFFSVNASGLFCGMAEMTGPVSFDKDMDFWQQDKWSGSFPVKWHIIKDVPNSYFRHIILQNNENKPVTNSRDTQEIMLKQGLEVLKIFKGHFERTSLLDDFVYYENRQRVMHDERNRLPYRAFVSPFPLPRPDFSDRNKKTTVKEGTDEETTSTEKKMASLTINPSGTDSDQKTKSSEVVGTSDDNDIVKVGSLPIKVTASSGVLTVGTIPLDSKSLQK